MPRALPDDQGKAGPVLSLKWDDGVRRGHSGVRESPAAAEGPERLFELDPERGRGIFELWGARRGGLGQSLEDLDDAVTEGAEIVAAFEDQGQASGGGPGR